MSLGGSIFDGLKFRKVYSVIHNLDPRMKFVYVIAVFVAAILFSAIIPLALLFTLQIPFVLLAKVQKQWIRSLRGAAILAVFIFFVNILGNFVTQNFTVTAANLENAGAMTLRFVVLVESFSVFFLTTSPTFGIGVGAKPCPLRVQLRLHHRRPLRARVGGGSPNHHGRPESPRVRTRKRQRTQTHPQLRPRAHPPHRQRHPTKLRVSGGNGVAGVGSHQKTHQPLRFEAA